MVRAVASPRRRSKSNLEPLASLLSQPPKGARSLPIAPYAWWQAVGPRIAERARPVRLQRGELAIRVASAAWAQELSFLAPTIIERLTKLGFGVQRLRFFVGPVEPPMRRPEPALPKFVPPPAQLSAPLTNTIDGVENQALREAIFRAASFNLAWQKLRKNTEVNGATRIARGPRFSATETARQGPTMPQAHAIAPRKP